MYRKIKEQEIMAGAKGMTFKHNQEEMYEMLKKSDTKMLLKKYLTEKVYNNVKGLKTKLGGTLAHCIVSGIENMDSSNGVYLCDPEGYDVFSELMDPIITEYHKFGDKKIGHPKKDFGDPATLGHVDPGDKYVVSTRVRVGRSAAKIPFPPLISDAQRKEVETKIKKAFEVLNKDPDYKEYKGKYYSLEGMDKTIEDKLIGDHFLFKNDDRFAEAAGVYRTWPEARGIYHNDDKTFLVWVNEEDHYRIISMQMGGDLGAVYKRLIKGIALVEKQVTFAHSDRLGFLTFCPTNLGTTLRASVHVRVPNLQKHKEKFDKLCDEYKLQARGIHGEHTESEGGIYDISNKRRLGISEIDAVTEMGVGVRAIIAAEKSLE